MHAQIFLLRIEVTLILIEVTLILVPFLLKYACS